MVLGTCVQFCLPCTLGAGDDTLLQPWSQAGKQFAQRSGMYTFLPAEPSWLWNRYGGGGTEPHSVWLL